MADTLDIRRRRAVWRASHRGTKELDLLIGRFASERLAAMDDPALTQFEAFLAEQDPELQAWLLGPAGDGLSGEFADLVRDMRAFHGLGS